jgi:hypothetical protein
MAEVTIIGWGFLAFAVAPAIWYLISGAGDAAEVERQAEADRLAREAAYYDFLIARADAGDKTAAAMVRWHEYSQPHQRRRK